MATPTISVPGQRISRLDEVHAAGAGTYVRNGFIYSSLAGFVNTTKTEEGKSCIEVLTEMQQNIVPSVDAIVTAKVTSVNPRFCKVAIFGIGKVTLRESFRGMLRKEDVRATEKDKVEMYKSFRPGDVILGRVLSLGDAQAYWLSTAENELGVVIATSEAGVSMVPISWCEMQCPKTLAKEYRKVAKVQPEYISLHSQET